MLQISLLAMFGMLKEILLRAAEEEEEEASGSSFQLHHMVFIGTLKVLQVRSEQRQQIHLHDNLANFPLMKTMRCGRKLKKRLVSEH